MRIAALLSVLCLLAAGSIAAGTVQPPPSDETPSAQELLPPELSGQGDPSTGGDPSSRVFTTTCAEQKAACQNGCPTGPDKIPCFQACQCQYLRCVGASCTE